MARWLDAVQQKIKLRTAQAEAAEIDKRWEALEAILSAQQKAHGPIPQARVISSGEGNLMAPVAMCGWSPEQQTPALDQNDPVFGYMTKVFEAIGLDFTDTWQTCIRKFGVPGNGTEEFEEHNATDTDFMYREMDVVSPKAVLVCGNMAVRSVFGWNTTLVSAAGMTKMIQSPRSGVYTLYIATYLPIQAMASSQMEFAFKRAVARAWEQVHYIL